jgi:2-polyprenyl-3-methyl-5-hydroxy-6-metoxy-1,4-benzoquinol methylase
MSALPTSPASLSAPLPAPLSFANVRNAPARRSAPPAVFAELVRQRSKHSAYQLLHPTVARLLGEQVPPVAGKGEPARWRCIENHTRLAGARVLDIGANTGYFSFAALEAGASEVVCYEGNAHHARFIQLAAEALGVDDRLSVHAGYYPFDGAAPEARGRPFDVALCLNVLHHVGDDFGDPGLGLAAARQHMHEGIQHLADVARTLVLQLGFNWQGRRERPIFEHGTKDEMIDFVQQAAVGHWLVRHIAVAEGPARQFKPLTDTNRRRDDALGEFFNRPLFVMDLD